MAIPNGVRWTDLESKGFVWIPGFLNARQLEACRADYGGRPRSGNQNFDVPGAGKLTDVLTEAFEEAILALAAHTSIRVDCCVGASYFATKRGIKFNWHQDHESYFMFQTHANYLNFYIPVVKACPEKSNLSVVPFDVLARVSPETFRRAVNSGATTVYQMEGGGQLLVHDDTGHGHVTPLNFDDIAATPQLNAGDLLLLRGDVFHKTQDSDTDRVALSVRMASTQAMVRRSKLAAGGLAKALMMARNIGDFAPAFAAFDRSGKDELSWGELHSLMSAGGSTCPEFPKRYLFRQKLRSGVVLTSAASVAHEMVLNRLKYLRNRRRPRQTVAVPHDILDSPTP